MTKENSTAEYRLIRTPAGDKYQFFCDLSHALVCTTPPIQAETPEQARMLAWNGYAKAHFNRCHKCGKWTINEMYNPDVLTCVLCTPIEDYPEFCPQCGAKTSDPSYFCHMCGTKLLYGGQEHEDKDAEHP